MSNPLLSVLSVKITCWGFNFSRLLKALSLLGRNLVSPYFHLYYVLKNSLLYHNTVVHNNGKETPSELLDILRTNTFLIVNDNILCVILPELTKVTLLMLYTEIHS